VVDFVNATETAKVTLYQTIYIAVRLRKKKRVSAVLELNICGFNNKKGLG
jgi:hypothetical protein